MSSKTFIRLSDHAYQCSSRRALKVKHSQVWAHAQDRQHTTYQLNKNTLERKMAGWAKHQLLYLPAVIQLNKQVDESDCETFDKPLWLPSQIGHHATFDLHLAQVEWQLRIAQAYEAIASIRNELFVRAHLRVFKQTNIRGQAASTRAHNSLKTVQERIDRHSASYLAARNAIVSLAAVLANNCKDLEKFNPKDLDKFPPLERKDIRELSELDPKASEGTNISSWIWKMEGLTADETDKGGIDGKLNLISYVPT